MSTSTELDRLRHCVLLHAGVEDPTTIWRSTGAVSQSSNLYTGRRALPRPFTGDETPIRVTNSTSRGGSMHGTEGEFQYPPTISCSTRSKLSLSPLMRSLSDPHATSTVHDLLDRNLTRTQNTRIP
jgi:hypothetical protein